MSCYFQNEEGISHIQKFKTALHPAKSENMILFISWLFVLEMMWLYFHERILCYFTIISRLFIQLPCNPTCMFNLQWIIQVTYYYYLSALLLKKDHLYSSCWQIWKHTENRDLLLKKNICEVVKCCSLPRKASLGPSLLEVKDIFYLNRSVPCCLHPV